MPALGGNTGAGQEICLLPIMEYEDEVGPNKKWNDIKYDDDVFNNLFEGLKTKPDFKLLFDYIFPLKRIVSLLSIRDVLNFEQSVKLLFNDAALFGFSKESSINLLKFAFDTNNDPDLQGAGEMSQSELWKAALEGKLTNQEVEEIISGMFT